MIKHPSRNKGFTLLEMIVVIAIIAILAAVIIPTTAGFIDRARFSNDRSTAARMSQIIEIYDIDNPGQIELDAHDVRTILNAFIDESFVFETESRDSGFFYLSSNRKIVAAKYVDIGGLELSHEPNRNLLSLMALHTVCANPAPGDTPEELFGAGRVLLNTGGDKVSQVVYAVRHLMPLSSNVETDYDALEAYVTTGSLPGFLGRVFGESKFESQLTQLLETFDPSTTLYVSNSNWSTSNDGNTPIKKIVFLAGISNIPTMNDGITLDLTETSRTIMLPKTVRTIMKDAFKDIEVPITVEIPRGITVSIHPEALKNETQSATGSQKPLNFDDLADYSVYIHIYREITNGTVKHRYDFSSLPDNIRESITGYSVVIMGQLHIIEVYSDAGLIATARSQVKNFTVDYIRNYPDDVVDVAFKRITSTSNIFEPFAPENRPVAPSGKTFQNWSLSPDSYVAVPSPLTSSSTTVYALWD